MLATLVAVPSKVNQAGWIVFLLLETANTSTICVAVQVCTTHFNEVAG